MSVEEHTIDLDSSPAFYRCVPASGAVPVYLHGVPTSSDDWTAFLELTGGVAPDLIGFGRSGKAGNLDYSLKGLTDFLERLLDRLQIGRVKLVGHDWGGAVGLSFAQRHPDRVERIVLLNAVPIIDVPFRWHRYARIWRIPLLGELAMGATTKWLLGRALREGRGNGEAFPQDRLDEIWHQLDQGTQRAILRLYRSADEGSLAQAGSGLRDVRMPALVLWGERDPWLEPALGQAYAAALTDATFELVPGAGHWPWLDAPAVIQRVATFLQMT